MMVYLNWTKAAILYEDEFGLIRLQDLVRSPPSKNAELYIRQTVPSNYRYDNYVVYISESSCRSRYRVRRMGDKDHKKRDHK